MDGALGCGRTSSERVKGETGAVVLSRLSREAIFGFTECNRACSKIGWCCVSCLFLKVNGRRLFCDDQPETSTVSIKLKLQIHSYTSHLKSHVNLE